MALPAGQEQQRRAARPGLREIGAALHQHLDEPRDGGGVIGLVPVLRQREAQRGVPGRVPAVGQLVERPRIRVRPVEQQAARKLGLFEEAGQMQHAVAALGIRQAVARVSGRGKVVDEPMQRGELLVFGIGHLAGLKLIADFGKLLCGLGRGVSARLAAAAAEHCGCAERDKCSACPRAGHALILLQRLPACKP